jgi:hypothetical protein
MEAVQFSIGSLIALVLTIIFMSIGKVDPYYGTIMIMFFLDFKINFRKK